MIPSTFSCAAKIENGALWIEDGDAWVQVKMAALTREVRENIKDADGLFKIRVAYVRGKLDAKSIEVVSIKKKEKPPVVAEEKPGNKDELLPAPAPSTSLNLQTTAETCSSAKSPSTPQESGSASSHTTIEEILAKADTGFQEALAEENKGKCGICLGPVHSPDGTPMSFSGFYFLNEKQEGSTELTVRARTRREQLQKILSAHPRCTCGLMAVPGAPRNVYRPGGSADDRNKFANKRDKLRKQLLNDQLDFMNSVSSKAANGETPPLIFPLYVANTPGNQIEHIVPLMAGGCPLSTIDFYKATQRKPQQYNLVPIWMMCEVCQWLDALFTQWQSENSDKRLAHGNKLGSANYEQNIADLKKRLEDELQKKEPNKLK